MLKHPKYDGSDIAALRNFLYDYEANFRLLGNYTLYSDRVTYAVSYLSGQPKNA
jgi:hypothetical protein